MIYNFDTASREQATAALLVYATYRSRDKKRFKITPEMWSQIQRFIQAAAKRSKTLPEFIQSFSQKMSCPSINPKWVEVGVKGKLFQSGSSFIDIPQPDRREFLTNVLNDIDHKAVLKLLRNETQWIVLLVRDRLETEKPLEATFDIQEESV